MHLIFQFPIIDLRSLLSDFNGRLEKPQWPNPPESQKTFIRNFGKVKPRKLGGGKDFTGESYYCDLKSVLKFESLHKNGFQINDSSAAVINSYRRYYNDGWFTGKVEIGLIDNSEKIISSTSDKENQVSISSALEHYSKIDTEIDEKSLELYKVGPKLAELYQKESTSVKKIQSIDPNLVEAGEPSIVLIYREHENIILPKHSFLLKRIQLPDVTDTIELHGYKLKIDGCQIKVYILKTCFNFHSGDKSFEALLRDLRMNLLRVHLEKETLRILLHALKNKHVDLKDNSDGVDLIVRHFKRTSEKLFRKTRYSIEQANFLDFALQSENGISPRSLKNLEEETEFFQNKFLASNLDRLTKVMEKKLVLLVCANPDDKSFTGFDTEYRQLKENLQRGIDRDNYDLEIELAVLKDQFADILDRHKPVYLHLSLHGTEDEGLYFEDINKNFLPMPVKEFKSIIKRYSEEHELKLIVISACNSQKHAQAVKAFCDFAIGTKTVFPVPAALLYSKKFYSSFFNGKEKNIEYCHSGAIQAIEFTNPRFKEMKVKNKIYPVHKIPVLIKK